MHRRHTDCSHSRHTVLQCIHICIKCTTHERCSVCALRIYAKTGPVCGAPQRRRMRIPRPRTTTYGLFSLFGCVQNVDGRNGDDDDVAIVHAERERDDHDAGRVMCKLYRYGDGQHAMRMRDKRTRPMRCVACNKSTRIQMRGMRAHDARIYLWKVHASFALL